MSGTATIEGRYEINEEHEGMLLVAAGLPQFDKDGGATPIPQELYDSYVAYRAIRDRIDMSGFSAVDFTMIVLMSGRAKGWSPKAKTAHDLFKAGELKPGDPLKVQFRGKDQKAVFIGGCGDASELIVQLAGDSEERRVPVETIKVDKK